MKIGIFGSGAFGLALSSILNENHHQIQCWTKFEEERKELVTKRRSHLLPKYKIPSSFKITTDANDCAKNNDILVLAIPTAHIRTLLEEIKDNLNNKYIVVASKGIEKETGKLINEIIKEYISKSKQIAILSGPSFATDIIKKKPIGLSVASESTETATIIIQCFNTNNIKLRYTNDVYGVEICGAIKNVLAIGSGIIDGLDGTESTQCMYLTEMLHDLKDVLGALDAKKQTSLSFAGVGDLLLTCTSKQSRNYTFGTMIGKKQKWKTIDKYIKNTTVEGIYTLDAIYRLLKHKKVNVEIINILYEIVFNSKNPKSLLNFLITKQ